LAGEISPMRVVPASIARPPYADTGEVRRWSEPRVKSPEIIERMRHAGAAAAEVLRLAGEMVRPGITTDAIDAYVHQLCIDRNSYPSPLNYSGYPKSVCTSVNEVICHGIPDSRLLRDGDIVNLDVTCYIGGVHGDTNATFFVGDVDQASRTLVRVTEECTWHGIEAVVPGRPLSDIAAMGGTPRHAVITVIHCIRNRRGQFYDVHGTTAACQENGAVASAVLGMHCDPPHAFRALV
jgi:methionyl aminopeptidase